MAERSKNPKTSVSNAPLTQTHTSKVTTFEDTTYHTVEQSVLFNSNSLNENDEKSYFSFFKNETHTTIVDQLLTCLKRCLSLRHVFYKI